jgi:hypothetical protein
MVDIPDTKVFAVKTFSERFKPWSLPYNHRQWDRDDVKRTIPIGQAVKTIGSVLPQMFLAIYKFI